MDEAENKKMSAIIDSDVLNDVGKHHHEGALDEVLRCMLGEQEEAEKNAKNIEQVRKCWEDACKELELFTHEQDEKNSEKGVIVPPPSEKLIERYTELQSKVNITKNDYEQAVKNFESKIGNYNKYTPQELLIQLEKKLLNEKYIFDISTDEIKSFLIRITEILIKQQKEIEYIKSNKYV